VFPSFVTGEAAVWSSPGVILWPEFPANAWADKRQQGPFRHRQAAPTQRSAHRKPLRPAAFLNLRQKIFKLALTQWQWRIGEGIDFIF
jgi:hypothetical protein